MTQRVSVVGAGQMGNGIAHVFAQSGFDVTMIDVSSEALAKGRSTIEKNFARQVQKGAVDAATRDAVLARISDSTSLAAVDGSTLVVEAATEKMDLKLDLFRGCDAAMKADAILASNTSSISLTKLAEQFVAGDARVDPLPQECATCHLSTFCRVNELTSDDDMEAGDDQ